MNRLAHENSPYLLQHRNNPVDWYPWGRRRSSAPKQEQKPIFLVDRLLGLPLVPRDGARKL